jgi:hypothetical protein
MNKTTLALLSLLGRLSMPQVRPTAEELERLRKRCAAAETAELGQILMDCTTREAEDIITAEINRRLNP